MDTSAVLQVAEMSAPDRVRPLLAPQTELDLVALPAPLEAPPPGTLVAVAAAAEGSVRLVSTLAAPGSALARVHAVAAAHGLNPFHAPQVSQEAAALVARPEIDDPSLLDLRHVPFVTIDNLDSRDLDQALYIERAQGGFLVRYALADASHFVRPGSALWTEALARGASYYLPGLTVPMLPRPLCEGVVSLNEGVDRRALVIDLRLDDRGECVGRQLSRAQICSRRQLTYTGVQTMLDRGPGHPLADAPFGDSLRLLGEVGRLRMAAARARGVIDHDRVELDISYVDAAGTAFAVRPGKRLAVERYNEQISLLANSQGALLLVDRLAAPELQAVFRVHADPPPEKLDILERLTDALVKRHQLDPAQWRWRGADGQRRPMAQWLGQLPTAGRSAAIRQAIQHQALRTNVRSQFDDELAPHHGVGARAYARFTAPMREVVGIFTHKEALECLGLVLPGAAADDEALRAAVIEAGNRAHETQSRLNKAVHKLVLDQLLGRDLNLPVGTRRWRRGTLIGLRRSRAYVLLDEPQLELKLYAADLQPTAGRLAIDSDGARLRLTPSGDGEQAAVWLVGERIEVAAVKHLEPAQRWQFAVRRPVRAPPAAD